MRSRVRERGKETEGERKGERVFGRSTSDGRDGMGGAK